MHLLSEQLAALVPAEEYSDVTFLVEEKRFPAHKVILAARCQYFRYSSQSVLTSDVHVVPVFMFLYTHRWHMCPLPFAWHPSWFHNVVHFITTWKL